MFGFGVHMFLLWIQGSKASGAFILTASHNPGGPNEVGDTTYILS